MSNGTCSTVAIPGYGGDVVTVVVVVEVRVETLV